MYSDRTLVLTIGLPENENVEGILTFEDISLASIPQFESLVVALTALGARHDPVNMRYRPDTPFVLSYVECRLKDVTQSHLLRFVAGIPTLVTLKLQLPLLGLEKMPPLDTPHLTTLILRGELPCIYQFLGSISSPVLEELRVSFSRNQWDKLDTLHDRMRDSAYTLALAPASFPALRTLRVEEKELHPRWSDVSFGCALRPLMHIPTLEDVEVQLDASPLWVSDDDLMRVAVVWPEVRRLVLTCKKAAERAPTLDVLSHVKAACRNMVELVLPKIILTGPEPDVLTTPGRLVDTPVGNHPLRLLSLLPPLGLDRSRLKNSFSIVLDSFVIVLFLCNAPRDIMM